MKRFLVLALTFALIFSLCACSASDNDESSANFAGTVSKPAEEPDNDSSSTQEPSESSVDNNSEDNSANEPEDAKPQFTANFISIGTIDTKVNASSVKSIPLTGVNTELAEGAIVVYYGEGCNKIGNTSDFAVAVFDYSDVYFGYTLKNLYEFYNGEEAVIELPQDGFVLAVHSSFETHIRKLKNIKENETVFPHGLHIYNGADYTVKKADTAPEIDGVFDADQWQEFYIEDVNASNPSWSYEQFQVNKYYSNAAYYTAYDDEYIYLAVVVDSPYHYCPVTMENPNAMYQYECIQVKVSSEDPSGEYIATNFDHVVNSKAVTDGVVRSYGFACNDNGDTVYYENGITKNFTGLAGCSRDDATQTTVYEVAIPFAEFNLTPASGMKLGLTFSINSTNEEDVAAGVWKNVTYRNGGGVIGRNDWTKIPVITLE